MQPDQLLATLGGALKAAREAHIESMLLYYDQLHDNFHIIDTTSPTQCTDMFMEKRPIPLCFVSIHSLENWATQPDPTQLANQLIALAHNASATHEWWMLAAYLPEPKANGNDTEH